MIKFIVLGFNSKRFDNQVMYDIIRNVAGWGCEIYYFDNCKRRENIAKIWNREIRRSDSPYICLLNNDILINTHRTFEKVLEVFEKEEKVGAVSVVTNNSGTNQTLINLTPNYGVVKFNEYPFLSGFFLMFRKEIWEKVGGFSEEYGFYGQETDFCARLVTNGFNLYCRTDVFVYHFGGVTAKQHLPNYDDERILGRTLFKERWPGFKH